MVGERDTNKVVNRKRTGPRASSRVSVHTTCFGSKDVFYPLTHPASDDTEAGWSQPTATATLPVVESCSVRSTLPS